MHTYEFAVLYILDTLSIAYLILKLHRHLSMRKDLNNGETRIIGLLY